MKNKWYRWLVAAVVIVLALAMARGMAKQNNLKETTNSTKTVVAQTLSKVKIEPELALTGNVEAVKEVLISAKVAGRVSEVLIKNGDAVTSGQPLVLLEDSDFRTALVVSQANLTKAKANLETTRSNYQRSKSLFESKAISAKDFEAAQAALDVAEADANSAAAAVDSSQNSLTNATISSPIGGVVANCTVKAGEYLSPGMSPTLLAVEDISSVYVTVSIEQKDLSLLKPGLKAEVIADTYAGQVFAGTVEVINPVAGKTSRVFETKIRVANENNLLRPGMFVKVKLETGEPVKVMAVPQNAVISKAGLFYVFVAEGDHVKRQPVQVGQVVNQMVEIKSGLTEGQKVVITDVSVLKDQDPVTIKN